MAEESPFQHFFATLGQGSAPHAADVNADATVKLEQVLKFPVEAPGRGILLRAPRAGFGKTHLIARTQQRLLSSHEFIPLALLDGARLDPVLATENALRRLTRQLPAGGGLTALDLQARRIMALALQPLVSTGEVPCQDREAALAALRQRPVETFDFHQPQAITAQWTRENFEILGPRLALELSRRTGTSLNETSFWLAAIFRFAVALPDDPSRTGNIIQAATIHGGVERFAAMMAMISLITRVVLVADDLEGLHADPSGALRLGSFLASVRQDAPRVDAIVSVNNDIWASSFEPALSGGLLDRLGEIEIRLESLDDQAIIALLDGRVPGRGGELFGSLQMTPDERYARKALRLAADRFAELSPQTSDEAGPDKAEVEAALSAVLESNHGMAHATSSATAIEAGSSEPSKAAPAAAAMTPSPLNSPFTAEPEPASPYTPTPAGASPFSPYEEESNGTPEAVAAGGEAGRDRIDDLLRQFRDRYGKD